MELLRYLTLKKFNWLLEDQGIYFAAAEDQNDKEEGIYNHNSLSKDLKFHIHINEELTQEINSIHYSLMQSDRSKNYINSWYYGDTETEQMWEEYTDNQGVIIVTDTHHLITSIESPLRHALKSHRVQYDDVKKSRSYKDSLKFKNEKFKYENEYRLVFDLSHYSILTGFAHDTLGVTYVGDKPSFEHHDITCSISKEDREKSNAVITEKGKGFILTCDLKCLIKEIRLPPNATEKLTKQIQNICDKHHFDISISNSKLE